MEKENIDETVKLTIRGVPARVKEVLGERAAKEQKSLNTIMLEALASAAGIGGELTYHDLDHLIGRWVPDPEFDRIIEEQNQIDQSIW